MMGRIARPDSEHRSDAEPTPTPNPLAPFVQGLLDLALLVRIVSNTVARLIPSPTSDDLLRVVDRRVRELEERITMTGSEG